MIHRTTMTLDEATIRRIKNLADLWGVSRAEAVRRAVEMAERKTDEDRKAPLERLAAYHQEGKLDKRTADGYLLEAADNAEDFRVFSSFGLRLAHR